MHLLILLALIILCCGLQMQKLESNVAPMQESITELSEKSGVLQAEKKLLEEDIKRWKARTQVRTV